MLNVRETLCDMYMICQECHYVGILGQPSLINFTWQKVPNRWGLR